MSIRIVSHGADARRGVDMLRAAQHLIVEAAVLLGSSPEDGGLWEALSVIAAERAEAERILSSKRRVRPARLSA